MAEKLGVPNNNNLQLSELRVLSPTKIIEDLTKSSGEGQKFILGKIVSLCATSFETCELFAREGIIAKIIQIHKYQKSDILTKILCSMILETFIMSNKDQKQSSDENSIIFRLKELTKSQSQAISSSAQIELFKFDDQKIEDEKVLLIEQLRNAEEQIFDQELNLNEIQYQKQELEERLIQIEKDKEIYDIKIKYFEINQNILMKIFEQLRTPFDLNLQLDQQILKNQDSAIKLIIEQLDNKVDDGLRKSIITIGIVDEIIRIVNVGDFSPISKSLSEALHVLTSPSSNEKNIYPTLLHLLDHPNSKVVFDIICTFHNIIQAGANTTPISEIHPHFKELEQNKGTKIIMQLLLRSEISKEIKDQASFCLSSLFRGQEIKDKYIQRIIITHLKTLFFDSDEWIRKTAIQLLQGLSNNQWNRTEIMKLDLLSRIAKDLQVQIQDDSQASRQIIVMQEDRCKFLSFTLYQREDISSRKLIISSGICDAILQIFNKRNLNDITQPYIDVFQVLTHPSNNQIKQQIYDKGAYPALIRLLDNSDENIVSDICISINNIIYGGTITTSETSQHPHYDAIEKIHGIKKIYNLFHKTDPVNEIKDITSICIGQLYRNKTISNIPMRKEIISHLKSIVNDEDDWISDTSKWVLHGLGLNECRS